MKNHGFKTLFFHRKSEGPGLKPYEKIGFSEQCLPLRRRPYKLCLPLRRRASGSSKFGNSVAASEAAALREARLPLKGLLGFL